MNARRITTEQLLNLADRAEGGLTPAEAGRLRQGLRELDEKCRALDFARRSAIRRRTTDRHRSADSDQRLTAIRALVASTRRRGARAVPVQIVAAILDSPIEIRQQNREAA
ncbi:hypothetical protein [Streptomyces zaomyceticus]|uniref:hypothetical protein n=1 Tax=Streptomyces zaomyceticus TaxID=68286 RepID=UPI0033ABC322